MSLARIEILKATLIGLLIACLILGAFVFTVVLINGEFTIDSEKFASDIDWGENVSIDGIEIIDNRTLGLVRTTLTKDMIVSIDDTEQAGQKKIVFVHNNREFTVYFDVKYKVEFLSYGEIIGTQRVFGKDELVPPVATPKTGYEFSHWDVDLSQELTGSIQVNAVFKEIEYPSLQGITATYGDTLGDVTLPSNEYGYWEFIYPSDTPVGNAGRQSFSVRFAFYDDDTYFKYGFVNIAVAKKQLEFIDVKDIFIYDGNEHFPTYSISEDVDVMVITSGSASTESGAYEYSFEIIDSNYEGSYTGTYEIQKPTVTVKVSSATVTYPAAVPGFTYEVEGFENVELLGIKVNAPAFASRAGEYEIGITYTNENVNYDIHPGTLTVLKGDLPVDAPEISVATFEDKLSDISFVGKYVGTWAWENPDQIIDSMEKVVAYAIFTHDDENLNPVRMAIEITGIQKKTLSFNITGSTFTYIPGTEHQLAYEIVGGLYPELYKTLTVVGNDPAINAGTYRRTLIINDYRYEGSITVELKITPATPATDFTHVYEVIWNENLLLSSIALPEGYAWKNPGERISGAGEHTFAVVYTPADTANYVTVNGEIKVVVAKSAVDVAGVLSEYTKVYDTFEYNIKNSGIYARYTDGALTIKYYKDGVEVDKIVNAGTYKLVITVEEGSNYLGTTIERTVTVERAENTQTVQISQTATYLDSLDVLRLPLDNEGTWSWLETEIGNAGTKIFHAIYTPDENANYLSRTVEVELTVNKKSVKAPSYTATLLYNGKLQSLGLENTALYTVIDGGGIVNGTYSATLTLVDPDNYTWETSELSSIALQYRIVSVENAWVVNPSISGWTYGDAPAEPSAKAKYGDYVVEYYTAAGVKLDSVPTNAGTYYAKFISTDQNCSEITAEVRFVIAKRVVNTIPTLSSTTFVYTGSNQKPDVIGADLTLYTVTNEGGVNVGSYNVTLILNDSANYRWSDVSGAAKTLPYSITKATAEISNLAISGWIYGQSANAPTADTTFGNVTYVYSAAIDGEYTGAVPTAAGTYYVKARVLNSSNYNGSESAPVSFTIAKASASITGLNATYTHTYNGLEFVVTGIGKSHGESNLVYTIDGVVVTKISVTNAGTYTVLVTLPESDNYLEATATATITVNKAETPDVVTTTQSATYLDKLSTLTLPESTVGTWSWKNADENTTVGNAGTNTFIAVFTPSTNNYNAKEVEVTVNVAKKAVTTLPTLSTNSFVYNGSNQKPGVNGADETLYTVTNNGGTSVGNYNVILTLIDSDNYKWSDVDGAEKNLPYSITKATALISGLTINGWIYGQSANAPSASTTFGTISYVYSETYGGEYTSTVPTLAGTYYVKAIVAGTDNYNGSTSAPVSFTVDKKTVTAPALSASTFVYTGSNQKPEVIGADLTLYTVTNNGATNVGNYNVTLILKDSANYKWSDVSGDTKNISYSITKATALISGLTINGWIYGQSANAPSASTTFGTISYVYSREIDGIYTGTVPSAAGTYYVKAKVADSSNYNGSESAPVSFTVSKAAASITGLDATYTHTYNGVAFTITGIGRSHNESNLVYKVNGEVVTSISVTNAGTYTVEVILPESDNYLEATATATITVNKAETPDVVITTQSATYLDKLSTLTLPTSTVGTWSWKNADENTTVGNAGINTFIAVFTPSTGNYNAKEVEVMVNVAKKAISVPTVADKIYNNTNQLSGLTDTADYNVTSDIGGKIVGTYTVTLTLTDYANHIWQGSDGTSADTVISYEIIKATNVWQTTPSIGDWTYNETASTPSAMLTYGDYAVEYKQLGADDSTYTSTVPTLAGDYVARFSGTDTHNCNTTPVTVEFTIEKANADITNIKDAADYVFEFNFADVDVTGNIGVSHNETSTITFTYVRDGVSATKIYEPGTYTVTVNATASANYKSAEATFTVVVNKIANRDTVGNNILNQNATYGDSKSVIILPINTDNTGVWVVVEDTLTVGNAGINTFTLKFTPNNPNYYSDRIVTIEVDVAKQPVTVPTIADKVYTGSHVPSGLTTNSKYKVTEGSSNVNVDTYEVELELIDSDNYVWSNGDTLTTKVTYNITKKANTDVLGPYTATYGDLLSSVILPTTAEGAWTWKDVTAETTVGNAGERTFTAVYTCSTGNYEDREVTVKIIVDRKALTTDPVLVNNSFTYGDTRDFGIYTNEYYTVTDNGNGNAGDHTVTVSLTANYKWSDGTTAPITLTYEILKAGNTDTVDTIQEATYGDMLSSLILPAASEKGSWSWKNIGSPETTPVGNFGEHKLIALFTPANSNYKSEEVEVTIIVSKKPVNVPTLSQIEFTYNTDEQAPTVVDNDEVNRGYYSITFENASSTNAGAYNVTLTLNNSNYMWNDTKGDTLTRTLTYTIKKASASINVADGALTQGRDYDKTVFTIQGITPSHTEGALVYSIDLATIKNAGTYTVVISLPECDNYEAAENTVTVTVTIKKAKVPVPSIDKDTFTYDTNNQKPTVINPDTELYTVINSGNINAGSYNVELTLKDSANYKWDVTGEESATYNIPYTINTATIAGLTISLNKNNWFYNEAYAQITASKTSAFGNIKVLYSANGTDWSETQPTDAGTYYVKAAVYADTNVTPNWSYAETAKETFTIKRIVVDKPTLSGTSFEFNNGIQAPTVVDNSATNRTYYTYAFSNASSKNAGSYTVTFSLINVSGVLNYEWEDGTTADFSIEYTIASYVPTVSVTIGNWIYDGSYADPTYSIVNCPDFLEGKTLRVVYTQGETTLLSAPKDSGTYTVTVYLDAEDSSLTPDWTSASASATFTISKVIVHKPTEAIVKPYTGSHVGCGVSSDYYYVHEGDSNVNVGEYAVRFELKDKTNYVWDDAGNTTADYETTYRISATANHWTTIPYVTGKDYDAQPVLFGAAAQHGGYVVTFYGQDDEGNYTVNLGSSAPSAAGSYKAVFVTTDTNHDEMTETVSFVIGKASVTAPTLSWTEQTFNGSAQAPTLENTTDSGKYTATAIVAYTNKGSYTVTVTLKDTANYKWADTESSDAITLTYTIKPITYTLSVSVGAWTYDDLSTGKVTYSGIPSCVTGAVTVEFKQRNADDSTYSTTVPTKAGNYTVRVTVAGSADENWAEQSKTANFTIDKLGISLPTLSANEFTYSNGVVQKPTVNGADDTTLYKTPVFSNENSTNAGTYSVTFGLVDADNYKWIGSDSADKTVTYEIKKANAAITVQKTEIGVVYNTTAFDPLALAEATENNTDTTVSLTWRISKYVNTLGDEEAATSIINAGTYTVVISLAGSANYNAATDIEVTVTVDKATVERPVIADREFSNAEMTSGLSSDLYSVTEQTTGNKNVGTYYAVLTLNNPENYKWAEAAVATFSLRNTHIITVPYEIVTKQSSIENLLPGDWVYGAANEATTSTPNHTFASVEYYYSTTIDGVYTTTKPTEANTYYVKAVIPADTVNNNWSRAETEPVEFTIAKADPEINVGNWSQTHTYNKGEYTIGSVTTNNTETDLIFTIISYVKPDGTVGSVPVDNKIVNAGTYTVEVSISESDNYNAKTLADKITVTVNKDKASFTVNQTQSSEFNNAVYNVLSTVTVNKGELAPTFIITEYKNSLGEIASASSIKDAGTYKLTISLGESDNYFAADSVDVTVTITKASVIAPNIKAGQTGFVYDSTNHIPELENLTDSSLYTVTNSGATNVGTYYVVVALNNTNNYEWQGTESSAALSLEYSVTKATYSVTVNVSTWTFGDDNTNNSKVGVTGIPTYVNGGNYTVEYKVKGAIDTTYSTTAPTNAGNYTVRITVAADAPATGNWDGVSVESDFTISKKNVSIKHESATTVNNGVQITVVYSGNNHFDNIYNALSLSGLVDVTGDGFLSGESKAISLTAKEGSSTNVTPAGTYELVAAFNGSANYNGCTLDVTVVVDRKPISVPTLVKDTFIYDETVSLETLFGTTTFVGYTPVIVSDTFNVGQNYEVTLTLDANHKWIVGEGQYSTEVKTLYYNITAESASITVNNTTVNVDYKNGAYLPKDIIEATASYTGAEVLYTIIKYNDTEVSDLAGITLKDAGTYVVRVTLAHNDNYTDAEYVDVTVVINKIDDASVENLDTTQEATYGDKLSTLTLPTSAIGTWSWADAEKNAITDPTAVTVGNAGTNTFYAIFTPSSDNANNYNSEEIAVTVSVAKASASITGLNGSYSNVYTGNSFVVSGIAGSHTESSLVLKIDGEEVSEISVTNVKVYNVEVILPESANYEKATATATITITKANAVISGFTASGWTYGDTAKTPTASTTFGTVRFVYSTTYASGYVDFDTFVKANDIDDNEILNAGSYYVKAVVDGTDNYDGYATDAIGFTVAKAQASITGLNTTYTHTYNGAEFVVSGIEGSHSESALILKLDGVVVTEISVINVKVYNVEVILPESTNYEEVTATATITVNPATVTVTDITVNGGSTITYGDAVNTPIVNLVTDLTVALGDYTVVFKYSEDGTTWYDSIAALPHTNGKLNAGTYQVKVVSVTADNGNWTVAAVDGKDYAYLDSFTVAKAQASITGLNATYTHTYNGSAFTVTGIGKSHGESNLVLKLDGREVTEISVTDVKVYSVEVILPESTNYEEATATSTITVSPATVTVTDITVNGGATITYGDAVNTPTITIDTDLTVALGGYDVVFKYSEDGTTWYNSIADLYTNGKLNAGTYQVKVVSVTADNGNWTVAAVDGKDYAYLDSFTVAKASATITGLNGSYSNVYTGDPYVVSGITGSHTESNLVYTIDGVVVTKISVTNAGTYTVAVTLPESANYEKATATATITITKASAVITDFTITDADTTDGVNKWFYGEFNEEDALSANTNIGTVIFLYSTTGSDDDYVDLTTFLLTNGTNGHLNARALSYYVKAVVDGTDNYYGDESAPVRFTINKQVVDRPTLETLTYNGASQLAKLSASSSASSLYTVVPNTETGGTNAGTTVSLIVKLSDASNYEWKDSTAAYGDSKEFLLLSTEIQKVSISFATNSQTTLKDSDNESWTFGTKVDSALDDFFNMASLASPYLDLNIAVELRYSYNDGPYVAFEDLARDENIDFLLAGTYKVKSVVVETVNYDAIEETTAVTFTINPKSITVPSLKVPTYDGYEHGCEFVDGPEFEGFEVIYVSEGTHPTVEYATNAGEVIRIYVALLNNENSQNYVWSDGTTGMKMLEVTVAKANNTDTVNQSQNATYLDKLSTLTLPTSTIGTWTWKNADENTTVGNAGTNTFYAIFTPYTNNYNSREVAVTVTVAKKVVTATVADDKKTQGDFFTGNSYIVTGVSAPHSEPVTIVYEITKYQRLDANYETATDIINAGKYWVNVTLESANYETIPVEIIVNIASATISNPSVSINGWTYGETANAPVTSIPNFAKNYVTYKYTGTTNGGNSYSSTNAPTDAGTYTVTMTVGTDSYGNWQATSAEKVFTISKAAPTITWDWTIVGQNNNINPNRWLYENLLIVETINTDTDGDGNKTSATYNKYVNGTSTVADVAGKFAVTDVRFAGPTSYYVLTFTPTDTNNFNTVTYTPKYITENDTVKEENGHGLDLKTVATIGCSTATGFTTVYPYKADGSVNSSSNPTAFGTIENAVTQANANGGGEVWVVADNTGYVQIRENCTVGNGVTLIIPFANDESGRLTDGIAKIYHGTGGLDYVTNTGDYPATYCKNIVVISENVKVAVQGILEVAGELSGGSGGHIAGHTARYYATIKLESNAEIDVNGELKVTGFIEEADGSTNSLITVHNGATIYEPLVIRDFKGGSLMTAIYYGLSKGYSPFNQYTVMNVSVELRMNFGSTMINYCNLQAQNDIHSTTGKMIGQGGLIELTNASYSYLVSKYDPSTGKTKLNIYGGAKNNSMSLVVLGNPVNSKDFNFAIPWIYDITLARAPGQTDVAKFNMPYKYKLMPGATMTVEQGAELTINWMIVYTEFIDTVTDGTNSPGLYLTYNPITKESLDEAKLIVRGSLISNTLGGRVYTDVEGAKVKVTQKTMNVISLEPTKYRSASFLSGITDDQEIKKDLELLVIGRGTTGSISGDTYGGMEYYTSEVNGNVQWNVPDYFEIVVGEGFEISTNHAITINPDGSILKDANGNVIFHSYNSADDTDGIKNVFLLTDGTASVTYTVDDGYVIMNDSGQATSSDIGKDQTFNNIRSPKTVNKVPTVNIADNASTMDSYVFIDANGDGFCEIEITVSTEGECINWLFGQTHRRDAKAFKVNINGEVILDDEGNPTSTLKYEDCQKLPCSYHSNRIMNCTYNTIIYAVDGTITVIIDNVT